jgi:lipopolysaccharide export system permease protein
MLGQLMMLFGFFSLVLVMVYWINRAVVLFDQLIADGQSAGVFMEFTVLTLPAVIRLALPLAAFAAAVYVTNRMSNDSELVVMQATGFSLYRLARPVVYFGLIVVVLMSLLMHFLVPLSAAQLATRQAEIARNVTARLLTPGTFIEPLPGVTFYISDITSEGELRDLFLSDTRGEAEHVTYTASRAFLVRENDRTQLVMIDGLVQSLRLQDQRLFTTRFADFSYDIGDLLAAPAATGRRAAHLSTPELLRPTPEIVEEVNTPAARLMADGHDRFSQSFLGLIAALIGFATLMVGGFSRFGVWKQIVGAIALIVVVKALETAGLNAARANAQLWFMTYLPVLGGLVIVWFLLFWASRPYLFKRRPRVMVPS